VTSVAAHDHASEATARRRWAWCGCGAWASPQSGEEGTAGIVGMDHPGRRVGGDEDQLEKSTVAGGTDGNDPALAAVVLLINAEEVAPGVENVGVRYAVLASADSDPWVLRASPSPGCGWATRSRINSYCPLWPLADRLGATHLFHADHVSGARATPSGTLGDGVPRRGDVGRHARQRRKRGVSRPAVAVRSSARRMMAT